MPRRLPRAATGTHTRIAGGRTHIRPGCYESGREPSRPNEPSTREEAQTCPRGHTIADPHRAEQGSAPGRRHGARRGAVGPEPQEVRDWTWRIPSGNDLNLSEWHGGGLARRSQRL